MDLPGRTIKSGARRTVVDLGPDAGEVVKIFHARGPAGLRDGLRARSEARAARALAAAGVPTPRLVSTERMHGAAALRFERVDGALSLAEALAARPRRGPLARAVADLLAALERAGATHPDLHPGNVLLGADGVARVIDVRGARVGRTTREWRRSAAALCGALRERHPRAVAAAARALRARVPGVDLTALAVEARASRREACARRVRVWLRDSAVTRLDPDGVVRVRGGVVPADAGAEASRLRLPRRAARRAWATLVRAHLHALPVAAPLALHPDGVEWAAPRGARAARDWSDPALAAELADRGLALEGPALVDARGRAAIGPWSDLVTAKGGSATSGGAR